MHKSMPPWLLVTISSATGGCVVLIFVLGLAAWAENTELDSGPRMVPYNGYLEFNGESFTGPADVRFTLTDDGTCNYTEDHEDIQVFAGKFSVDLGTVDVNANPIPTCLFDADRVFLEMAVRGGNDETDHIPLAGRQRITPVPFAYWAAEGSDFKIDGDQFVSGDVVANGNATIGTSNVRPPTNQARMELRHNVADTVDNFNDFQFIMWRGGTAAETFGQGIQSGTMFFNVPNNNQYNWYHNGTTRLFQLKNPTSTLDTDLNINGALGVTGNIDAPTLTGITSINSGGLASSFGGNLTVGGALSANSASVTGALSAASLSGAFKPARTNWNNQSVGAGQAAIVNDNVDYEALMIVGNNSEGGVRKVEVFDDLQVHGNIVANGNVHNDCVFEATTAGTTANGETLEAFCSNGRYMAGYRRYHGEFDYGIETFTAYCCRL